MYSAHMHTCTCTHYFMVIKDGRDNAEKERRKRLGSNDSIHTGTGKTDQLSIWFYIQSVSTYNSGI